MGGEKSDLYRPSVFSRPPCSAGHRLLTWPDSRIASVERPIGTGGRKAINRAIVVKELINKEDGEGPDRDAI